jgi:3-hydroxybutyryl-CoA dehydrogenase
MKMGNKERRSIFMSLVGVIGAGVMGRGVAQNLIQSGIDTILLDISSDSLESAKTEIENKIRLSSLFKKPSNEKEETISQGAVRYETDIGFLNQVDYIIENITENLDKKEKLYINIRDICLCECTVLVNTSCISITKIASLWKFPEKVIGAHFMNPVALIPAVEVIKGYYTSKETVARTESLLRKMGKESIVVNDYPGFVSNRISHLLMNEAAFIVQDGVADAGSVDEIFKKCYGHKMGPLETADLIGLDTVVDSLEVLYQSYQDGKFRCCPLLKKMVDAGLHGQKSGRGFYEY